MESDQDIEERVRNIIAEVFHLSSHDTQGELSMGNPGGWGEDSGPNRRGRGEDDPHVSCA